MLWCHQWPSGKKRPACIHPPPSVWQSILMEAVKEGWWFPGFSPPFQGPSPTPSPHLYLSSVGAISTEGVCSSFPKQKVSLCTHGNGSCSLAQWLNVCKSIDLRVDEIPKGILQKLAHLLLPLRAEIQHSPLTFPTSGYILWFLGTHCQGSGGQTLSSLPFPGFSKFPSQCFPSDFGDLVKTESHITCYGITESLGCLNS